MPFLFLRPFACGRASNTASRMGVFFLFTFLACAMLVLLGCRDASCAMPRGNMLNGNMPPAFSDSNVDAIHGAKAKALKEISGSPWPGVIDHLLQRPLPETHNSGKSARIHINYPSFGKKHVDSDIRSWVENIADTFQAHLDLNVMAITPSSAEIDMEIDKFLQDDDQTSALAARDIPEEENFELWGSYTISRPSSAAVSITYEIWNYMGSGDGNLDIITLNYNLLNGQRLNFVDIFEKPDLALNLMSTLSRRELETRLGSGRRAQMLHDGTEPLVENFSSITLTPEGICINFQPWQVAPWAAGAQKVEIPLEELLESAPLLALWGK